ncbi:MAG TPA: DNA polymerase III subunit epsilon [Sutterella sp.]|nr:DNA polymerase III subunit epsilon [Sutterella sp.]
MATSTRRQVALDTETTGMDAVKGDRLIEIGCVEILNRRLTQNVFHTRINPEREVDAEAAKVHGMTWEVLKKEPKFEAVVDDFLDFIKGAELLIHNAEFDVGFIDHELGLLNKGKLTDYCAGVVDTLKLAQDLRPGQRNNLDTLCAAYKIDASKRVRHGAEIDAELLAEVYLAMTQGQESLDIQAVDDTGLPPVPDVSSLRVVAASEAELKAHEETLKRIDAKDSKGKLVWR